MNTIYITPRNVYGADKYYPACETAQLFANVAGAKTLTPHTLGLIKAAGYEIVIRSVDARWSEASQ